MKEGTENMNKEQSAYKKHQGQIKKQQNISTRNEK